MGNVKEGRKEVGNGWGRGGGEEVVGNLGCIMKWENIWLALDEGRFSIHCFENKKYFVLSFILGVGYAGNFF